MPLWFFSLPSFVPHTPAPAGIRVPTRRRSAVSPVNLPSAALGGRVPVPSAGSPGTDGAAGDVKPVGVFWASRCRRH